MKKVILGLILICVVAGCSVDKQSLGLGRQTPDEFVVMKRQPLSVPPEYNLEPPEPGKAPLKQNAPEDAAEQVIFGKEQNNIKVENRSLSADDKFLKDIDAKDSQANIRELLHEEAINDPANNKYLINNLMFWKEQDNSVIIDNMEEAKRIKQNKKHNISIDYGEIPVIEPKK